MKRKSVHSEFTGLGRPLTEKEKNIECHVHKKGSGEIVWRREDEEMRSTKGALTRQEGKMKNNQIEGKGIHIIAARSRYAIIAGNQWMGGRKKPSLPHTLTLGRIASRQKLYGDTGASRPSSIKDAWSNLTAATTSPPPRRTIEGAAATSLEQNGRSHVRITLAVHGRSANLSKRQTHRRKDKEN